MFLAGELVEKFSRLIYIQSKMRESEQSVGNITTFIQYIREEDPSNMGLGEVGSEAEPMPTMEELHQIFEKRRLESVIAAHRALLRGLNPSF